MSERQTKSKNEIAWEKLFKDHNILSHIQKDGVSEISSEQINLVREARLMTKFDHKIQLPKIFRDNGLTILPNSRGTYIIGTFSSYEPLPDISEVEIENCSLSPNIQTINPDDLFSESTALLCAYNSGMIAEILEEDASLTVLGRMSTGRFNYFINNNNSNKHEIFVNCAQCEIDSGFESERKFALLEAKNEEVKDFHIRQLYYPYRLWRMNTSKEVIPIFLSISDGVFSFYQYRFADDSFYNSLELVKKRRFQIGSQDIHLQDIIDIVNTQKILPEPENIPFPQADSFNRVIDLITQIHAAKIPISQEYITTEHAFDVRQTQYYTNAGAYLGLIERQSSSEGITYALTEKGSDIVKKKQRIRSLELVKCILEHKVFNEALREYLNHSERPSKRAIEEIMKNAHLTGINNESTTISRRALTVLSWIDWIIGLTKK